MAKFTIKETAVNGSADAITVRLGAGTGSSNHVTITEVGKPVKLIAESRFGLCVAGDPIQAFVAAVESFTQDDYSIGSVVQEGFKEVTFDGLQATPGTGTVDLGDFVVTGTVVAKGTALSAAAKVTKATVQPGLMAGAALSAAAMTATTASAIAALTASGMTALTTVTLSAEPANMTEVKSFVEAAFASLIADIKTKVDAGIDTVAADVKAKTEAAVDVTNALIVTNVKVTVDADVLDAKTKIEAAIATKDGITLYAWRVVSLGSVGSGAVGTTGVIQRVAV